MVLLGMGPTIFVMVRLFPLWRVRHRTDPTLFPSMHASGCRHYRILQKALRAGPCYCSRAGIWRYQCARRGGTRHFIAIRSTAFQISRLASCGCSRIGAARHCEGRV